jgi:ribosomal protein L9
MILDVANKGNLGGIINSKSEFGKKWLIAAKFKIVIREE